MINYQKGRITLNPINIVSGKEKAGQQVLEISVYPESNDVIGLQDLYLQLDISNSLFEPIVDEIASGLDPSGSTYITSSSYANGSLVRPGGRNSGGNSTISPRSAPTVSTPTSGSGGSGGSGGGGGY